MTQRADETFHALHASGLLLLANCWDAGSARLAEHAGSKALATSSAAVAWAHGYGDGSLMPGELQVATARAITHASSLPLTVDAEDGYSGDPAQVADLVRRLMDAGVVGINLEDGRDAPELLCRKIEAVRAAADAAGVRLFINARTDVYLKGLFPPAERVAETLRRGRLYEAAGASGLFAAGVSDEAEIAALVAGCAMPLNVLARPGLAAPARLEQLGVRRLSAGSALAETMYSDVLASMQRFMAGGEVEAPQPPRFDYRRLNDLIKRV